MKAQRIIQKMKTFAQKMPRAYQVAAFIVVLGISVLAMMPHAAPHRAQDISRVALVTRTGETVELHAVIGGRPAVINAWASWCPFCTKELPDLVALQKEFGDAVVVIGVNRNEDQNDAEAYLRSIGAEEGLVYLYDPFDFLYQTIGGYVMPETIFVSPDGHVVTHVRGPLSPEEMRRHTQLLILGKELPPMKEEPSGPGVVGCRDGGQCFF